MDDDLFDDFVESGQGPYQSLRLIAYKVMGPGNGKLGEFWSPQEYMILQRKFTENSAKYKTLSGELVQTRIKIKDEPEEGVLDHLGDVLLWLYQHPLVLRKPIPYDLAINVFNCLDDWGETDEYKANFAMMCLELERKTIEAMPVPTPSELEAKRRLIGDIESRVNLILSRTCKSSDRKRAGQARHGYTTPMERDAKEKMRKLWSKDSSISIAQMRSMITIDGKQCPERWAREIHTELNLPTNRGGRPKKNHPITSD